MNCSSDLYCLYCCCVPEVSHYQNNLWDLGTTCLYCWFYRAPLPDPLIRLWCCLYCCCIPGVPHYQKNPWDLGSACLHCWFYRVPLKEQLFRLGTVCTVIVYLECPIIRTTHGTWVLYAYTWFYSLLTWSALQTLVLFVLLLYTRSSPLPEQPVGPGYSVLYCWFYRCSL